MNPTPLSEQAHDLAARAADLAHQLDSLVVGAVPLAQVPAAAEPFIFLLTIFLLACFVGYYVVWNVTPALHSPLMALSHGFLPHIFGFIAVTLASVNIFGGFLVTQRMLSMFKSKK
jgi:NAD(P) transhydrogenase subunit alpha